MMFSVRNGTDKLQTSKTATKSTFYVYFVASTLEKPANRSAINVGSKRGQVLHILTASVSCSKTFKLYKQVNKPLFKCLKNY